MSLREDTDIKDIAYLEYKKFEQRLKEIALTYDAFVEIERKWKEQK